MAARFQSELSVLLREAQNAEAAAEGLHGVVKLLDHTLNENLRLRTDALGLCKEIRLVPVSVFNPFSLMRMKGSTYSIHCTQDRKWR